ncbi:ABC transporter substrate-binding protein [Arthrobacter sp. 08Y14]|uniref:ABC transporter substrate-binding protein n=1 Tax=Arthrobacter sp. 08Y14 TaxID=2058885 RepID=UPI000CE3F0D4|nr:ABC transporter substrate-binding protein [Arthrobacter sp. 08Y14]
MRALSTRQRRRGYSAVAVIALALSVSACAESAASESAQVESLNVGSTTSIAGVGVRNAIASGKFEDVGLSVTATGVKSGNDAVPQLLSGDLQIAQVDTTTAMQAIEKGIPVKILAAAGVQSTDGAPGEPSTGSVLVTPDSDIKTAADLEGKNLGVPAINNQIWMNIRVAVDEAGGDSSQVKFIEIPGPQAVDLLLKGDVDATTASEPMASATVAEGKARLINSTDVPGGKGDPSSVYIATTEFIAQNPDTLKKFVSAVYTAQDEVNKDKELGKKIAVEQLGYKTEQLANAFVLDFGTQAIDSERLGSVAEMAVKYGILSSLPDPATLLADVQ